MQWFAQAPANIALIKYMGKTDPLTNTPSNPSLSYTLPHLRSNVRLEAISGKTDFWEPLSIPGAPPFSLSLEAQERFLQHLSTLKEHFHFQGSFLIQSSNNFPTASGLASSAASFAALTKCAVRAITELQNLAPPSQEAIALLSKLGSGSSCRSFFSPWALWDSTSVREVSFPYTQLHHEVILISHEEKTVSSRKAHMLVQTSPLFAERPQRATTRLHQLEQALNQQEWHKAFDICWEEFQDMHHLFATSTPAFSYFTENTATLLRALQAFWQQEGDGPLVTMDAGPNIHLLYREDQQHLAKKFKREVLIGNYDVL
jgi:diphosphomevalonate decarboxylase